MEEDIGDKKIYFPYYNGDKYASGVSSFHFNEYVLSDLLRDIDSRITNLENKSIGITLWGES